ncbi:DUF3800 domain-containing protein [Terasakiella sp. SH-1]|uniref:DUF3800 domain-containing protein n=1 Tax=Terasakiella sp. SH-1 TaxID=2560057 RepID=UPI0010733754|nr:DUF3800 domain-containing protein [Terasakiella sp. SH-1]
MGQSKIPYYAYVDETGNTGHNIFDENQPDFFTAALITSGDFDKIYSASVQGIAKKIDADVLHAQEFGLGKLELIADELLRLFIASKATFFVSRVEKKYLLATKVFDSLCDSGENAAVAWHHYNIRPLRIMLMFKLSTMIDEETAKMFWKCILEPKEEKAYALLPKVCERLLANIDILPDAKSKEILGEALTWAKEHKESIQIHVDRKISRQGHFPNLVAFTNLLDGLEKFVTARKKKVAMINHDEQIQFKNMLTMYHNMYSNASSEEISWAGETYYLSKLSGSEFVMKRDEESAGIQIADVVLWLYSQFQKGKKIPLKCAKLLDYVFANGWENDFSFRGVERVLLENYGHVFDDSVELTNEQKKRSVELLKVAEENRQKSMAQYEKDGLPPFMRSYEE